MSFKFALPPLRRTAIAMAAVLGLAACGGGDDQRADVLRVGSQRGSTKAVMIASGALDGAPYRVEWSEFAAAQPLLEAVGAGAIDVGVAGDAPFMFAYQSGSPIKAVGVQRVETRPADALVLLVQGKSPARSIADLKGRKVATTRGSVGHYLIIRALELAKLPPDWINITFLPPGDAKAAFESGAVDGWATWTPYVKPSLNEGARVLVDGKEFVRSYGFDVAHERAIRDKAALLRDFLKREARALVWARANSEPYAKVLASETGLPIEIARDYAVKNARTAVPIDDRIVSDLQGVVDTFQHAGAGKAGRNVADAFDRSFAAVGAAAAH